MFLERSIPAELNNSSTSGTLLYARNMANRSKKSTVSRISLFSILDILGVLSSANDFKAVCDSLVRKECNAWFDVNNMPRFRLLGLVCSNFIRLAMY